jgi:hypothetical protein
MRFATRVLPLALLVPVSVLVAFACGTKQESGFGGNSPDGGAGNNLDATTIDGAAITNDAGVVLSVNGDSATPPQTCPPPAPAVGSDVVMAAPYTTSYTAYILGAVPGVPDPLGGCVVSSSDPNTLYVAGNSEDAQGAIYSIGVTRDACGHITGFVGTAVSLGSMPYVDANLVYGPSDVLFYTEWPTFGLAQLLPNATSPSLDTNLQPFMVDAGSAGGLGFVPPTLAAAGELRASTWPNAGTGGWFHIPYSSTDAGVFAIGTPVQTTTVTEGGGFAYVPSGSPQFSNPALLMAEWQTQGGKVAAYDVDSNGDPVPSSRRDFFSDFPSPWGAYFDAVTGDYLFLSWGVSPDEVYEVQGFTKPPPPPPPPK